MEAGNDHLDDLVALFDPDATYTEPFTDSGATHTGRDAIRAYMKESWAAVPPDLTLEVTAVRIDPPRAEVEWNFHSLRSWRRLSDATTTRSVTASSSASEPNSYNTPSRATSTD